MQVSTACSTSGPVSSRSFKRKIDRATSRRKLGFVVSVADALPCSDMCFELRCAASAALAVHGSNVSSGGLFKAMFKQLQIGGW